MRFSIEELFEKKYKDYHKGIRPLIYSCYTGTDGVRYGSFKPIMDKKTLAVRTYSLIWSDYDAGIKFLDVLFDPRHNRHIYMLL
jgi:hypothetical protein